MLLSFVTPHPSIARDPDATSGIALRVRLRVAVTLSEAKRNRMGLATLRDEGFPETSEREFWGFAIRMTSGDCHLPLGEGKTTFRSFYS